MNSLRWNFPIIICSLCFIGGCAGATSPDLRTVTGRITLNGLPVQAEVVFQPDVPAGKGGRASTGQTTSQGTFQLNFTQKQQGAVPGWHRVIITLAPNQEQTTGGFGQKWKPRKLVRLRREVRTDRPNHFEFPLTL